MNDMEIIKMASLDNFESFKVTLSLCNRNSEKICKIEFFNAGLSLYSHNCLKEILP